MDNQIYISQLSTSFFSYNLLFKVKKIDVRPWNESLYWCFLIVSIRNVLPTPWLSIQFTPYLIGGKNIQMVLGLILQLYLMVSKTWVKDALHFTFLDRIFARVRFYKFSFFIPPFRHQDSNSYYLVLATAKIPKIWKCTTLDVYFSICRSQNRASNRQWIIQPKLIDCPSDTSE